MNIETITNMEMGNMDHAVAFKDQLLKRIDSTHGVDDTLRICQAVATILEHTEGLWQELAYCYKAREIAERCTAKLAQYSQTCQSISTIKAIATLRSALMTLGNRYATLQAGG